MDDEDVMEAFFQTTTCGRCGITTDRHHLRGIAGCSHGPDCCKPAPQYDALVVRAARTLVREIEVALA